MWLILDSETKPILVQGNINTKNSRNVLTSKSVNFVNFTLNSEMTILKSQANMTESISKKMTI